MTGKWANWNHSGFGIIGGISTTDFHVVDYNGLPNHLSLINANFGYGYGRGHSIILDSSYRIVAEVHTGNGRVSGDLHEFNVLPGGKTALQSIYQPIAADLTAYNVTGGQGWLLDNLFQEIDIETGAFLFEWRASTHVDLADSYLPLTRTAGTTPVLAWDFFHLNAVDKDSGGNYVVSSRHYSSIYSISSTTGEILWTSTARPRPAPTTPSRTSPSVSSMTSAIAATR